MNTVKNIIFDFGGVLADWNPRYFYRSYFDNEEQMEWFLANICTTEWNEKQDAGRDLNEGTLLLQNIFPEHKEAIGEFYKNWNTMLHSDIPQTAELLKELKSKGYGIFGLSNWSAQTIGSLYERYDVFKEFDGVVLSGEEGITKPDAKIFYILLERYNLKPEECVFIDDNPANTAAADAIGFKTITFKDASSAREELIKLEIV